MRPSWTYSVRYVERESYGQPEAYGDGKVNEQKKYENDEINRQIKRGENRNMFQFTLGLALGLVIGGMVIIVIMSCCRAATAADNKTKKLLEEKLETEQRRPKK